MGKVQLSLRIDREHAEQIAVIARDADLSANAVAVALLHAALDAGWTVEAGAGPVVRASS